jgi:hypothetical protein
MSSTQALQDLFETFLKEDAAFTTKGNKAAGTRARGALGDLAKLAKVRRAEIQAAKNEAKASS